MAAVICYLPADNHTADTRLFNSPETGRLRIVLSFLNTHNSESSLFYISV